MTMKAVFLRQHISISIADKPGNKKPPYISRAVFENSGDLDAQFFAAFEAAGFKDESSSL